jgi:hypothetical protein
MATPKEQLKALAKESLSSNDPSLPSTCFQAHPHIVAFCYPSHDWNDPENNEVAIYAFDDGYLVGVEFVGSCSCCGGALDEVDDETKTFAMFVDEYVDSLEWFNTKQQVYDYLIGAICRKQRGYPDCILHDPNGILRIEAFKTWYEV